MYDQLLKDPSLPVSNPTASYWQQPLHKGLAGIKSKTLPQQRDIVIIGSGITGCSIARELLSNGHTISVTVLEAREVCSGATGRNGGRINCTAVQDFDKYTRMFGVESATKIVRFELAHQDEIFKAASGLGPELFEKSEVRRVGTVACVFSDKKLGELKDMLAKFEAAMPEMAGRWRIVGEEARDKYGIKGAKGALVGDAGAAWPYRLITSLFEQLLRDHGDRFSIESKTPALSISRGSDETHAYAIVTPRGTLRARHVVHCTEGHTSHLVPELRGILVPRRGQMAVINPGTRFNGNGGRTSWSFYYENGFDYASQNPRTREMFIGGGDVGGVDGGLEIHGIASDGEETILQKSHLTGILPVLFGPEGWQGERPGKPLLKSSWTGILCNSLDRVPLVGMLPQEALGDRQAGSRRKGAEWISAGYGGYGMVNAWLSGKAVAQQLLGQDVPEWLPIEYRATPERLVRLKIRLSEISGSQKHLKALL